MELLTTKQINMKTKEITEAQEHKSIRKKLWIEVYVSYTGASNSVNDDSAHEWADRAVQRFDERFSDLNKNK